MKTWHLLALLCFLIFNSQAQNLYPNGTSNCIARWTFDTTETIMLSQLTDQSGNGNSGFTNNISSVKGFRDKSGKAGGFDGNSSFAQIPHNNLLNPSEITIFSLIKFNKFYNGLCQGNNIVYKGFNYNSDLSWAMYIAENDMNCSLNNPQVNKLMFCSPNYLYTPPQNNYLDTSIWYCLVTRYDGVKTDFYEIKMDTNNHISNVLPDFTNTVNYSLGNTNHDVYIGATQNPPYKYWLNASIDEIVIFNRALTNNEIQGVYDYMWGWNLPNSNSNVTYNSYFKYQIGNNYIRFQDVFPEKIEIFTIDSKYLFSIDCFSNLVYLPSTMSKGIYFLKMNCKGKPVQTIRVVLGN
ncbi:MAG: hypothetical protein JNM95_01415 [Chitinophagaceae bacterium]|nr:hypothetical protein [Chitinophagaceae bacterium]